MEWLNKEYVARWFLLMFVSVLKAIGASAIYNAYGALVALAVVGAWGVLALLTSVLDKDDKYAQNDVFCALMLVIIFLIDLCS